jgi:hypothetical protein
MVEHATERGEIIVPQLLYLGAVAVLALAPVEEPEEARHNLFTIGPSTGQSRGSG